MNDSIPYSGAKSENNALDGVGRTLTAGEYGANMQVFVSGFLRSWSQIQDN
jgi:hypothetical protein